MPPQSYSAESFKKRPEDESPASGVERHWTTASTGETSRPISRFQVNPFPARLVLCECGRKAVFRGVLVQVKQLRRATEQIRRQVARLIIHPSGCVGDVYFPPRANHLQRAKTVQDYFDFTQVAFRHHHQEIVVCQAPPKIRPTARFV